MDPRVEEILMAKIASDNAAVPTVADSMTTGAALGGSIGLLGTPGGVKQRLAGGLVNTVLGGMLGPAVRNFAIQESPEMQILARAQAQGDLSEMDKKNLANLLAETYSKMGLR